MNLHFHSSLARYDMKTSLNTMTEPILSALKLVSLFHFKSRTYDQYIFQKADPHALNKS
jgi:hypothetical protein